MTSHLMDVCVFVDEDVFAPGHTCIGLPPPTALAPLPCMPCGSSRQLVASIACVCLLSCSATSSCFLFVLFVAPRRIHSISFIIMLLGCHSLRLHSSALWLDLTKYAGAYRNSQPVQCSKLVNTHEVLLLQVTAAKLGPCLG